MGAGDRLVVGMRALEVCHALLDWRFHQVHSVGAPARYHTWDFISPDEMHAIRVTFDGNRLILWGEPTDSVPRFTPMDDPIACNDVGT
jgi:hypothetical protein